MPQSYSSLYYHLVFSTKHRRRLLNRQLRDRLFPYLGGILRENNCRLIQAGGIPDHVHLLSSWRRDLAIAQGLQILKTNSSSWIHRCFPGRTAFAWQTGYAAFTVSHSQLGAVSRYIQNQEIHHRTVSFQEELRRLLEFHEVRFDERFLLD